MKQLKYIFLATFMIIMNVFIVFSPKLSAAFNPNLIMDDTVFNTPSMSAAQIDAFLNSFPASCISTNNGFSAPNVTGYNPNDGFLYGPNVSAGTIIYNAATAYDLNPQVILATLQKEQSLVSGSAGCHYETPPTQNPCPDPPYGTYSSCVVACQYAGGCVYIAMGYDCPYYCVPGSTGFSKQIIKATWKLKFVQQRSLGNYNWNIQKSGWDNSDDPITPYSGYMTEGLLKRNASSTATYFDGLRPVNSNTLTVHLDTGATASLYSYTPFTNGNNSFVNIFQNWFGGTVSASYYQCRNSSNIAATSSGAKVIPNRYFANQRDTFTLTFMNNTGSTCLEAHTWGYNYQNWITNVATNHPAFNPADGEIISGNIYNDNKSELIFVKYRNTGSGKIEIHTWDTTYQKWISNMATNYPMIDPTEAKVIAADTNGDGFDELIFVKYRNTGSGKIEIHTWAPGYQAWSSNIATSHTAADSDYGSVISGNVFGEGRDRLLFVKYTNTGTGKIEIHTWAPGYQAWSSNVPTTYPSTDPSIGTVIGADVFGENRDRLVYIKTKDTGTGKIEIHTWAPGYQAWSSNVPTSYPAL